MNAAALPADRPTMFESAVCGRCGGTGHYSYNQVDGTRCYGCGGRGRKMTKRGDAAQRLYRDLLSKPLGEFEVGDRMVLPRNPIFGGGGLSVVTKVAICDGKVDLTAEPVAGGLPTGLGGFPTDERYRFAATAEQKQAAKDEALAYQANLTKQGKPRKRQAPVAA